MPEPYPVDSRGRVGVTVAPTAPETRARRRGDDGGRARCRWLDRCRLPAAARPGGGLPGPWSWCSVRRQRCGTRSGCRRRRAPIGGRRWIACQHSERAGWCSREGSSHREAKALVAMSLERVFHCDGPDCERHVKTRAARPPMFLVVSEHGGPALHFCGWDCVLRHAATKEPETALSSSGSPDFD